MNRPSPPLLGFNNNVRYKGRLFHIQTEDSGAKYCRVVTHLFADGGRILRTSRTDYSGQANDSDRSERVRHLMKEQHRAMFTALRAGEFDEAIKTAFESTTTLLSGVPGVPADERPALRAEEMPPLSLPVGESASTAGLVTPTSRRLRRESNRPNRRSSRPPAPIAGGEQDNPLAETPPATQGAMGASGTSTARFSMGRPPMDSSENTRYSPNRSLFGDTDTSEPSLGDVILSYVEDSKEKGSGRA